MGTRRAWGGEKWPSQRAPESLHAIRKPRSFGFTRLKRKRPQGTRGRISLEKKSLLAVDDEGDDEGVNDERLDEDERKKRHRANRGARARIPRDPLACSYRRPALRDRAAKGRQADRDRRREVAPAHAAAGLRGFLGKGEIREKEGQGREAARRDHSLQHVESSFRDRKSILVFMGGGAADVDGGQEREDVRLQQRREDPQRHHRPRNHDRDEA